MILKKKTQNTFAVAGYHHRSRSRFSPIPAPPLDAERLICVEGEAALCRKLVDGLCRNRGERLTDKHPLLAVGVVPVPRSNFGPPDVGDLRNMGDSRSKLKNLGSELGVWNRREPSLGVGSESVPGVSPSNPRKKDVEDESGPFVLVPPLC